ncbi:hypothetical protein EVAR_24224_1 [Eumeta japonica]|uniref:Uncharacterized protein n=1 Tax=Eumeta variegata TaxID=151549 RepID=A0A4C1W4Q1_EUMVA|nr:hypothetical protein EVAR_24224_1 [Eumeta japonica]
MLCLEARDRLQYYMSLRWYGSCSATRPGRSRRTSALQSNKDLPGSIPTTGELTNNLRQFESTRSETWRAPQAVSVSDVVGGSGRRQLLSAAFEGLSPTPSAGALVLRALPPAVAASAVYSESSFPPYSWNVRDSISLDLKNVSLKVLLLVLLLMRVLDVLMAYGILVCAPSPSRRARNLKPSGPNLHIIIRRIYEMWRPEIGSEALGYQAEVPAPRGHVFPLLPGTHLRRRSRPGAQTLLWAIKLLA